VKDKYGQQRPAKTDERYAHYACQRKFPTDLQRSQLATRREGKEEAAENPIEK